MFEQLGMWITSFLSGYVARVVAQLCRELVPVALSLLTVYIGTYGFAIARGAASESLSEFSWRMVKISFILAFALGAGTYMNVVFRTADGMQDSMATVFVSGGAYDDSAPTTVFGALDTANDKANGLLKDIWKDAGIMRIDLVVASIGFSLGTVVFLVAGTIATILSKVLLAFLLAIGPMAILTLMFKPTAKFFDAWLSTMLSAVVMAWFVFFALGLSFFVVGQLLETLQASGAFGSGAVNAVEAACTYLVFAICLGYLVYHSPQYAAALTGGAAVQHGGQMLASYLGSRAGASAGQGGGGAGAGGEGGGGGVSKGGGAPYTLGRVAGMAGAAAGQATLAAAAGAVSAGRRVAAAYQRAAHRGNRR